MNLFENAILLINKLIEIKNKQNLILITLGKTKDSTTLLFKIKNYRKWIENLNHHNMSNTNIRNKDDIINLNFKDKLTYHLINLFESGYIEEINNAEEELRELTKLSELTELQINKTKLPKEPIIFKNSKVETELIGKPLQISSSNKSNSIDTSTIEAKPKILNGEVRPNDLRGGIIFDLRYIHGIGPVNAIKIADSGVTLEGLLSEWKEWVSKDYSNSILMPSKMPIPSQYTISQWNSFDIDKQYSILESNFKKKLDKETKQLSNIHIHKSSLVGIKHFHDMSLKIPREEIKKAESILKQLGTHMNKDLLIMICGSYRRGMDKSGDVDCLITHPLIKTQHDLDNSSVNLLANFVKLLIKSNFIIDQLDMGTKKFMGFCNIIQFIKTKSDKKSITELHEKHIARRIDIRLVPYESYGSAILYFTGSRKFNTDMRIHALKKGYSLSEFGLKSVSDGTITPCFTEEEVFKILNYPYKKPEERNI